MTEKVAVKARRTETDDRDARPRRAERAAPVLRVVPERVAATGRAPFVLLVVGLLAGGLVALLVLNVALAQDAYRLHELQKRTSLLAEQRGTLERQVAAESAPGVLAEKAERQGMVPAGDPAFIDVAKGKVHGKARKAGSGSDTGPRDGD